MGVLYLPSGSLEIAPASTLNRTATYAADRQMTLAGAGQVVRVTYGQDRIGGHILNVLQGGYYVIVQVLWGFQCTAVSEVMLNNELIDDAELGAVWTHYTGSQSTVDATLAGAFSDIGVTYADTLAGYAYSVIQLPPDKFSGSLNITGLIKGRTLYDPRDLSTTWNTIPALALADFLTNTTYGAGLTVDWTSVGDAADFNLLDLGGGEQRRTINLTLTSPQRVNDVIETLRTYAGCFLVRRGSTIYLVPDEPRTSDATYAHASGQVKEFSAFEKRDLGDSPTVMEVVYTDTSSDPWKDASAFAQLPGVGTTLPRRQSTVRLPGIQSYSQARREAVERLNKLTGNDLVGSVTVFDAGIAHEMGDIVTLSLPIGIVAKDFRIASPPTSAGPGLWKLEVVEYDPAVYDLTVQTAPTYPDTTLPNPNTPPAPTSVTAEEELFQQADGSWNSRVRVDITPSTFMFLAGYRVEVWDGSILVDAGQVSLPSYATPPLQEGVAYTIKAAVVSTTGAAGTYAQTSITFQAKRAAPTDVTSIDGFEVGGDVYLSWAPAYDLDLRDYELRYGTTSDTWATATLLDRIVALRYISKGVVSPGVRRFFIKARDSVGNYSANAVYCDVTVTIDPDSMQIEYRPVSPTLTSMVNFPERDGSSYDVTVVGTGVVSGVLSGTMSTYTYPLAAYWGGTSSWQGDTGADPWGVALAGDWSAESTHAVIGTGSATLTMRLSEDGTSFTDYTSFPAKDSARYARVKIDTTTCVKVTRNTQRVYANAVTRSEYGSVSVTGTGTPGAVVQLTNKYFARRYVQLTPIGTGATYAVADNVQLTAGTGTNSFDVYAFNAAGSRVAATVDYVFQGI